MAKPLIELGLLDGPGFIIGCPSGVCYTNQTGGYICHHPEMEGVYIPISRSKELQEELHRFFYTGPKWKGWCCEGIDAETADFIDELLGVGDGTEDVKVNRAKLAESEEAWIHVIISPGGNPSETWSGFSDTPGILTWENSD